MDFFGWKWVCVYVLVYFIFFKIETWWHLIIGTVTCQWVDLNNEKYIMPIRLIICKTIIDDNHNNNNLEKENEILPNDKHYLVVTFDRCD